MLCQEFLERHTEFRDGLITYSRELRRFARHIAHCTTCRRYDGTIREAVQALHAASPIAPSPDFRQRLDARLAVERRRVPRPPAQAGVSATMLVLAAVALFVVEFAQRPRIARAPDRKSTRLNSSHGYISYAVFCLKKKKKPKITLLLKKKNKKTKA